MTKGDINENMVARPMLIMDARYNNLLPFIKIHNSFKFFKLPPPLCINLKKHKKTTGKNLTVAQ